MPEGAKRDGYKARSPRRIDLPYMVTTTVKSTETKKLKETTVYNLWSQQKGLPLIYAERGHVKGQLAYVT